MSKAERFSSLYGSGRGLKLIIFFLSQYILLRSSDDLRPSAYEPIIEKYLIVDVA